MRVKDPARLYYLRPEWRGIDRQGRATPRFSDAYLGVRQFVISSDSEEMATNYPIDGECILYDRTPPLVEYEPPAVEGFTTKYGKDPRQLDERDPKWLSY